MFENSVTFTEMVKFSSSVFQRLEIYHSGPVLLLIKSFSFQITYD